MSKTRRRLGRVGMAIVVTTVMGLTGVLPAVAVPYEADWGVPIGDGSSRGIRTIDMALGPEGETAVIQTLPGINDVAVTRVTMSGLDPAFGTGGEARARWDPADVSRLMPRQVAVQDDGRILVAGEVVPAPNGSPTTSKVVGVVRLLRDGSLDPGFDGDGRAVVTPPTDTTAVEVGQLVAGRNGRIVVATVERSATGDRLAVRALGTSGRADKTFGTGGRAVVASGAALAGKASVGIVANGRVVTGANVCAGTACRFTLARLNPNGAHDTAFGGDGIVEIEPGPDAALVDVYPFLSGEVLVVGWARDARGREPQDVLVRLRADGSGRPGYGTDGIVRRRAAFSRAPTHSAVQPDGKVLLSGGIYYYSEDGGGEGITYSAIVRLRWNGSRDTTFGQTVTLEPGTAWEWDPGPHVYGSDWVQDLAVRPNGDILELSSWFGEHSGGGGLSRLVPSS